MSAYCLRRQQDERMDIIETPGKLLPSLDLFNSLENMASKKYFTERDFEHMERCQEAMKGISGAHDGNGMKGLQCVQPAVKSRPPGPSQRARIESQVKERLERAALNSPFYMWRINSCG
ncbi:unnamed protein product [Hermetia illucens]|uniref:Uncharacterized protein n=1 Tax=Hermetia illucens TaxID=343691 RepID=A0A7R8UN03_HERIL|nr:unnamed protein product [Hermetia illucens]